jgi:hypothetical protein
MFDKALAKKLTRNRVHSIQIHNRMKVKSTDIVNELVVDNAIRPNRSHRLFLANYNEVDICKKCY